MIRSIALVLVVLAAPAMAQEAETTATPTAAPVAAPVQTTAPAPPPTPRLARGVVPMGGDMYRASVRLSAFRDQSRVQDVLMYRAAQTAQAQGAIGFIIVSMQDASETGTIVAQASPSMPAIANRITRPGGDMLFRLVRAPAPEGVNYIDAAETVAAIGPRVQ